MEEENIFFDYEKEPGKALEKIEQNGENAPRISIITSYYNAEKYLWQTFTCVENQTFPYWEWIIVDDGSTSKEALEELEKVAAKDSRIHVYHKKNEGLAKGRDYALTKAKCKYIFPLDADDLIDKTMLECSFWCLETFKDAVWCYSNIVGFENMRYLDARIFNIEKMKTDNQITATALIRREKIEELGGYSKAARHINEDWHLWLRMLQKGYFPVHMRFYGFWYRRKEKGSLLKQINNPHSHDNELRLEAIKEEAKKIKEGVQAIELPEIAAGKENEQEFKQQERLKEKKFSGNKKYIEMNYADFPILCNKESVLIVLPWIRTDTHLQEVIKKEKGKHITILTTKACPYIGRRWYEDDAEIFDMTTFLGEQNQIPFVNYIIKTRNVSKVYFLNTDKMKLEKNIEIICENYQEDESKYAVYQKQYEKSKTLFGRIKRKLKRLLKLNVRK